ncbi:MAG: hypothetical protein HY861_02890 [Chlamydiia bacterium]|nr:hypothetical protein [Chlamydiia bacterium]
MRKFSLILLLALIALACIALTAWVKRESILAHFLSRQLHAPVTLHALDLSKQGAKLQHIVIGNPPYSKTPLSFSAKQASVQTTFDQITANPLIIDSIEIDDIFVGIEIYDAKKQGTNWDRMLYEKKERYSSKEYLIRTLILRNLSVEVTQANGSIKRYPTIRQIELRNISNETGFPVGEIQKAIFQLMLQDLFKQLHLENLLKGLLPSPNLPLPYFGVMIGPDGMPISRFKKGTREKLMTVNAKEMSP